MQVPITLDTIGALDNDAARLIINKAIDEAVADLDDRGEDEKEREVIIKLTLKRMDGADVVAHVTAYAKLPPRRTHGTVSRVQRQGSQTTLQFQTWAPDDPNQRTIDERLPPNER
jgi:hypothetical protein